MVTNYPQELTNTADVTSGRTDGIMARALGRVGALVCGLRGHDAVLHFEGKRVMMRCTSCGHNTPGWEITGRGPRRRFEGDARHHVLNTPRLALNTPRLVLRKTA